MLFKDVCLRTRSLQLPWLLEGKSVAAIVTLLFWSTAMLGITGRHAGAQNANAPVTQQMQEGAKTTENEPVHPTVDKGQYNLFNPTPDDQMRPFSTDRPGKSHSSVTVDAGHFQYEGDFLNYTYDRSDGTTTRDTIVGTPNLKLGITNWAELDLVTALYNSVSVRSGNGAANQRPSGFGDVFLGGKVNFFGNDNGDQALGAIGFVKIPTAGNGLGNDAAEFFLNIPFTTALPDKFSLTVEPAINLLKAVNSRSYQGDYQVIFNLNRPIIGDAVTAAIELALDFPGDPNVGRRHTIDPSLQWLVTPNLQLDAGIYIGISKAAPDYNPYFGVSFRY